MEILFIIKWYDDLLGIEAAALSAPVIDLTLESVPADPAFHLLLVTPGNLILGVVAQEQVGAGRVRNIHRIGPSNRIYPRHATIAVSIVGNTPKVIIKFVVPVHRTPP